MSFDRWHPLDANMIAADEHYERASENEEIEECPECGEELEFDEDDLAFCPECGWHE